MAKGEAIGQIYIRGATKGLMQGSTYILENTPPPTPREGKYQLISCRGTNMKRGREKRRKCKRKSERGKKMRKGGKGSNKSKIRIKAKRPRWEAKYDVS
jgi:hypothetical protein